MAALQHSKLASRVSDWLLPRPFGHVIVCCARQPEAGAVDFPSPSSSLPSPTLVVKDGDRILALVISPCRSGCKDGGNEPPHFARLHRSLLSS